MPEKEYVYKSEHCRYLGLTYSKRQNESLYLMCCGIEKCHPGYFFATADRPIAIGNPLKLSPDFPPLHTVRATFTAHG
ncbi:MAG: hypothetical protein LIP11_13550, partial [Clostridiales bacterium]|nr:hypothetical protein [Clostridiales bacterium]